MESLFSVSPQKLNARHIFQGSLHWTCTRTWLLGWVWRIQGECGTVRRLAGKSSVSWKSFNLLRGKCRASHQGGFCKDSKYRDWGFLKNVVKFPSQIWWVLSFLSWAKLVLSCLETEIIQMPTEDICTVARSVWPFHSIQKQIQQFCKSRALPDFLSLILSWAWEWIFGFAQIRRKKSII